VPDEEANLEVAVEVLDLSGDESYSNSLFS
jgi:hypothetical protein